MRQRKKPYSFSMRVWKVLMHIPLSVHAWTEETYFKITILGHFKWSKVRVVTSLEFESNIDYHADTFPMTKNDRLSQFYDEKFLYAFIDGDNICILKF